jgi:osmotically-inducible protein OsmY
MGMHFKEALTPKVSVRNETMKGYVSEAGSELLVETGREFRFETGYREEREEIEESPCVAVERAVYQALSSNPHLCRRRFECQADERGAITLHGKVDSWYQKQLAQEAIRHVHGVNRIYNELEVLAWS